MTGRERVLAALARQPVDRPPVCNPTSVATVGLMDRVDAPFPQANRDPETMSRLAATSVEVLGFDTVMPVFSVVQESSALGCRVAWGGKSDWPTVRMSDPIWREPDDIRIPPDLLSHPDTTCVLAGIRQLKRRMGQDAAVIGKTMGPWSLAYHCFGVEPFLLMTVDDPGRARACLDRLKEVTVAFGLAQVEAGADALTLPDHATGDLVSARYYATFLRGLHTELVDRLPIPVILHICGRTLDRLPDIARTGAAAFHFESKNDPAEAVALEGGRTALVGNVNNPTTLADGTPKDVTAEVRAALEAGVGLIGPECAVPLNTPVGNLQAIPRAVRAWCAERRPGGGPQTA